MLGSGFNPTLPITSYVKRHFWRRRCWTDLFGDPTRARTDFLAAILSRPSGGQVFFVSKIEMGYLIFPMSLWKGIRSCCAYRFHLFFGKEI